MRETGGRIVAWGVGESTPSSWGTQTSDMREGRGVWGRACVVVGRLEESVRYALFYLWDVGQSGRGFVSRGARRRRSRNVRHDFLLLSEKFFRSSREGEEIV